MIRLESTGVDELVRRLDAAVRLGSAQRVTRQVKRTLEELIAAGSLQLSDRYREPRPDCYARRLLHRSREHGYTAIVMTWGPGQRTALHDHSGIWCVEGVVEGRMNVTQYDLVSREGTAYCFEERGCVHAGVGSAGCLIPPYEYHVLANGAEDRPSVTLHVYGGEMTSCHVFEPVGDRRYERRTRSLTYHD